MVDLSKPSTRHQQHQQDSRTTRVMTHLTHSILSQLTKLNPSLSLHPTHTSLVHSRLQSLFPSLHTPTHPPYALMIRNAIMELKEGTGGSTENAISEFIKRENSDLPWAHAKILSLQLKKLCEIGEIARAEGGRYVVKVDDETEKCEGSGEKKKRGKRKRGCDDSVEGESEERLNQVFGKQGEAQSQDSGLLPAQLLLQMPRDGPSGSGLDAAAKILGSLSLDVQECKQDEDLISGHADHQRRERKSRMCKQIADHQGESLLPSASGDANVIEEKPNVETIDEQCLSQLQDQGISRERGPKLHRNVHHINKKIHSQDLMCSSDSSQKETSSSSQSASLNSPVNQTHSSGQQLDVPPPKGSLECKTSRGIKLPPTELQQKNSSDIDLGKVYTRNASLTCDNLPDDNHASPKEDLDEDHMSWDSEQKPPKRPRGRPRKLETVANCPEESLLPIDDDIHNGQSQNIKKMEKQHQYGRGRGRGRGRSGRVRGVRVGQGSRQVKIVLGRGRGRPPKLNQIAQQCEGHLQQEYKDKQHSLVGGRGTGRGRGRPPKLHGNPVKHEQSQIEDQAQLHEQRRGRGRPRKLIHSTNRSEAQEDQTQQHVRGRGRPRKLNLDTNQCEELSHDQVQGPVSSPSSGRGEQKQLHEQSWGSRDKSKLGGATPSESRSGSQENHVTSKHF